MLGSRGGREGGKEDKVVKSDRDSQSLARGNNLNAHSIFQPFQLHALPHYTHITVT